MYYVIFIFILLILLSILKNENVLTIYKNLFLFILILLLIYFIQNPTLLLIPYNLLIENLYEKKVFYTEQEKYEMFPTAKILENLSKNIKEECINILNNEEITHNVGKDFIIEDEKFWKGWTTFPLRMFNKDNEENMKKSPILTQILKSDANITTAFLSILEPGKSISSHYGPFKGILRYHLGLIIPPKESGECFISVDNEVYEWKEGEGILFDESYKHFVKNETNYKRVVLFLDIKRPFNNYLLTKLNDIILYLMNISPYN